MHLIIKFEICTDFTGQHRHGYVFPICSSANCFFIFARLNVYERVAVKKLFFNHL